MKYVERQLKGRYQAPRDQEDPINLFYYPTDANNCNKTFGDNYTKDLCRMMCLWTLDFWQTKSIPLSFQKFNKSDF